MTTYQSQTVYTVDREGNSLAFSTVNEPGEEAVLKAAVDIEMPDGQRLPMSVLYNESDVQGLLAYLHDNFGRGGNSVVRLPESAEETVRAGVHNLLAQGYTITDPQGYQLGGDHLGEGLIPCTRTDPHHHMRDGSGVHWVHDGLELNCPLTDNHYPVNVWHEAPQNDAGAVPPPANVQGAANTPQSAPTDQLAAESATAADTAEAAPASAPAEPKKRKRRKGVEIAYDEAMSAFVADKSLENSETLAAAYEALKAKDPGNERVALHFERFGSAGQSSPAAGPAFAPEQLVAAPNYFQQANHPVVQEMAQQFGGYDTEQTVAGPWSQRPDGAAEYNVLNAAAQEATQAYQAGGQVLIDAANNAGYDVPGFQPGQAQEMGTVTVAPEEQAAAQAFPCPVQSSDGRPCQRPYGHEIQTATNPQPKPHVYATIPSQLGVPAQPAAPLSFQVPPTPEQPRQEPGFQPPAPAAPSWAEPV